LNTNGRESADPGYQALLATAAASQTPIYSATAGDRLTIGDGVTLEVINPPGQADVAGDNNSSIVLRLVYGEFSLLLTGDAEARAESAMTHSGQPLQAIILKAGHHGSNSSTSTALLDAVRPQYVVLSVGEDNDFGHPAQAMLERAAASGATILSTAELGTIEVTTDGQSMWWQADAPRPLP
jgi:competence protein ComEC